MDLRIFVEPQQGNTYAQQLGVARAAEEGGFDAFFRSDHYARIGGGDPGPGPTDSWVTLGGLALQTTRIRLGTLLTSATFRYPGPLAIAVAQVDEMSGGRVELGLGAGWYEAEHTGYGLPFPSLGERFDRLTEQLDIITGLWTTPAGETFSYQGRHYQLADSPALPKPTQRPRPPVIIGGFGPVRTPRLAATYGDEYNAAFQPLAEAARLFDQTRKACEELGRDPDSLKLSVALTVCCGRDEAELARRAEAAWQPLATLREAGLAGTPSEIVDRIGAYAKIGADRIYLQVLDMDDLDHVALLAAEVLPHV
ncbi:LLM class F420-dependent oxidoreductase [Frankia sp. CNm7]|uniref:LLM class F420-dependent oxidoreductase n=1 Tax=Frankia nepalensis TaxID=1836974 RepID=A0A937RBN9_9ACTN|nr:LLM class F420-dependent oxidoreductase [Frankia nepalensis]MBL7497715.1 LLM class F420-dependent oxidoreductase [Frankia nepalensis]MBL7514176.1 LLM class F420-dependent oxidoreductase [Frankia nepalensis]MBL7523727.1 LLM class F420-dependent oxidoreductase [Frankia nepalensis]MBL7629178.1 LLM class F420-dependent oxidoreductase [Frankia nepalensis]